MTRDPLDDLLERTAPVTRAAEPSDLRAMIASARREVPRPRRAGVGIAAAALSAVLIGGAGVAVATDGFTWAPWAQDPVGAVAFTMSNGFSCELRFSEYTAGGDAAFVAEVNRALEEWYGSTDVVAAAQPLIAAELAQIEALEAAAPADPGADLSALPPDERDAELAHRAWAREWLAWDLVVNDLEVQALAAAGLRVPDDRLAGSERSGQIECADEQGDRYAPGAGS